MVTQNFKITNEMHGILSSFNLSLVFKMTVYLKTLLVNSSQKNLLANDEPQENLGLYSVGRHSKATDSMKVASSVAR